MSRRNHVQQQLPSLYKLNRVLAAGLKYNKSHNDAEIAAPTDKELRRDDKPASLQRERSRDDADSDPEEVLLSAPLYPQLYLVGNNYPADPRDTLAMLTRISRSQLLDLPYQHTALLLSPLDGQGFVGHMMQLPSDAYDFEMYAFCKTPIDGLVPIPGLRDPSKNKDHPYVYGIIED